MVYVDIGLKRSATFSLAIQEKLLVVMVEVDIGPRTSTLPLITQVAVVYCFVYLFLLVIWVIVLMKMKEVVLGVMFQDVEVRLKRSVTLLFTMMEKVLMVM